MRRRNHEEVRDVRCAACQNWRDPDRMYLVCGGCRDRGTPKTWRRPMRYKDVQTLSLIVATAIAGMIWVAMQ